VWWRRHAWILVWITVFLTPAALLSLRLIDDTSVALVLPPLLIGDDRALRGHAGRGGARERDPLGPACPRRWR